MKLVSLSNKIADIIFHDPASITVLNRFGIRLGVGNMTLEQACSERGLDAAFVEAILNISLNEDYFPERAMKTFALPLLEKYLLGTDRYYTCLQLPNIARHLDSLINHSRDGGNLELLRGFFGDLRRELTQRAEEELHVGHCLCDDWQPVADRISDLLSFFVVHLRGDYNENLCNAVVNAIFTLDHDLRQTARIRRQVLIPLLQNV